MIEAYLVYLATLFFITALSACALNLAMGYTGIINLSHMALFGIGAYTSALLVLAGVPFVMALPMAGIVSALFGIAIGRLTVRLSGDYLAFATLAFAYLIYSLEVGFTGITRGPFGIIGIPRPSILGFVFQSNEAMLLLVAVVCTVCIYLIHRIASSPYGRLLEAVRDDEVRVQALGKNTARLKLEALAASAFFAGVAGSFYAHYISFIDPSSFTLSPLAMIVAMVVVGGLASTKGAIIGTLLLFLVPEGLRFFDMGGAQIGALRMMVFSAVLMAVILWRPKGIFGRISLSSI
ncbi:Branched-chain amino acid transport system / permease component [Candidatus Burarchaeum australiense]|nr:Branched-chain amino acid transport system / permease component [Candidatus Burarchaeum australiense]